MILLKLSDTIKIFKLKKENINKKENIIFKKKIYLYTNLQKENIIYKRKILQNI